MAITPEDRTVVESYFRAMQAGPHSEDQMVALFADDAEYIEPFSGQGRPTRHQGIQAIREFFHASFEGPMGSGVKLTLERLDVDGETLRSVWTCVIPMMPGPFHGADAYTIREGKILRLETTLSGSDFGSPGADSIRNSTEK